MQREEEVVEMVTTVMEGDDEQRAVQVEEGSLEAVPMRISFGVKRSKQSAPSRKNLLVDDHHKGDQDEEEEEDTGSDDLITHLDSRSIIASGPSKKKAKLNDDLIIPVIVPKEDWRLERLRKLAETSELSAEDQARLLLLEQVAGEKTQLSGDNIQLDVVTVEKAISIDDPDYGAVPIDRFGMAILRGCGWRDGDAIGKTNRQVVPLRLPTLRPKGLGLGATPAVAKPLIDKDGNAEPVLKPGCCLQLTGGPHREAYGKLEAFDEDNARIFVRLALGGAVATVSQFSVRIVDMKEYERNAKCINKTEYDREKRRIAIENGRAMESTAVTIDKSNGRAMESTAVTIDKSNGRDSITRSDVSKRRNRGRMDQDMWVCPELTVRFVDRQFKGGRLFKQKMIVCDASGPNQCSIRDASGVVYHDVKESWLETVIPKEEGAAVMAVMGRWRGRVGRLLGRDRRHGTALVQLVEEELELTLPFAHLCAWNGPLLDE